MIHEITIKRSAARIVVFVGSIALCAVLGFSAVRIFIAGLLSDERARVDKPLLVSGLKYVPDSAAVRARLAQSEMRSEDRDLANAEANARRAIELSPWDFTNKLILASIEEVKGDRVAAESALREAQRLAPNNRLVRWRLANALLRQGKLGESLIEFRAANSSSAVYLGPSLDLVWKVSGGNLAASRAIVPDDPKSRIYLAHFLIQQGRVAEAASVFANIEPAARMSQSGGATIIDALIVAGHTELARYLWADTITRGETRRELNVGSLWDGGFESGVDSRFAQFAWNIGQSAYARAGITSEVSRTGERSLRLDFTGRDTARLDDQIMQRFLVKPGTRYKLECYVKTDNLVTPEGARVVVASAKSSEALASSEAVAPGSSDWRPLTVEFAAPASTQALVVAIRRIPKFSYDDPTSGTIWFDDFSLIEQKAIR